MVSMIALIVSMVALAVGFLIAINGILSDGLKGLRQKGKPIIAALIVHIPDREPRLHGVLAPPCRKGAPLFHEQF